jgi:hypothetical protein
MNQIRTRRTTGVVAGMADAGTRAEGDAASVHKEAPAAPREGLCDDSDDDAAELAAPPPPASGAPAGGADGAKGGDSGAPLSQEEQLKEQIDSLKAALHAERASGRDKDVQIHKLLAERDMVVGACGAGRPSLGRAHLGGLPCASVLRVFRAGNATRAQRQATHAALASARCRGCAAASQAHFAPRALRRGHS